MRPRPGRSFGVQHRAQGTVDSGAKGEAKSGVVRRLEGVTEGGLEGFY